MDAEKLKEMFGIDRDLIDKEKEIIKQAEANLKECTIKVSSEALQVLQLGKANGGYKSYSDLIVAKLKD